MTLKNRLMKIERRVVILLAVFVLACSGQTGKNKFVKIYLPDGFSVTAELAVSDEERQQGLMFRERLPENQGMLFIFEEEARQAFWMKNMKFSIDILWLDSEKRIVHIERNVPPCLEDPCPSYAPTVPAKFVLELDSGGADSHKLQLYDRIEFILSRNLDGF